MASLAEYEKDKADTQTQLDAITAQLRDDPDNAELKVLETDLQEMVAFLDTEIAQLKPTTQSLLASSNNKPPAVEEKPEKVVFSGPKKGAGPAEEEAPIHYQVNDTVLAKWSGDKSWYPAKITSITGSSTAPVYTVKYKSYDQTETLRSRDIRPVSNKRKETTNPAVTAPLPSPVPHGPGVVTSAAPTMNPGAKRELDKTEQELAKPKKSKKIKAKKELEANQNKWQSFQKSSKMGKSKKDSMFRTPEGVNGRVGFTGSGQAMRVDPTRSRHVYQMNDDLD